MENRNRRILQRYLPEAAIDPFLDYWQRNRLALHISRERSSKLGDYRLPTSDHPQHAISVNGSLNRYMFLWVLLHEMAHLDTFVGHGRRIRPHGHEWQQAYALLMQQYGPCFPVDVQPLIEQCSQSVPLRRNLIRKVEQRLTAADQPDETVITLDSMPAGTRFRLKSNPHRRFQSVERRRTRWICDDLDSQRRYLVSGSAAIEPLDASSDD